jgi:hypothetical protein
MTKYSAPARAADEARRKERRLKSLGDLNVDLEEALDDSFPASDPPSMTQPETEVGSPSRKSDPGCVKGRRFVEQ